MIYGITGKPGSGKTYLAVKMALKAMKRGTPVFSNLHIFGARYAPSLISFLNVKKGLIVIDELNVEAGARNIRYLPPQVYRQWSQHRHRGIDLIWTAQTINRIDIIMRELTNEVFNCHSFFDKFYWYSSFQPEELMTPMGVSVAKKPLFSSFRGLGFFQKKVYSCYSSEEEIVIPPLLARKMANEWGYIEKDIVSDPVVSLPVVNEVKQHDIDFQQVAKDKKTGLLYTKNLQAYLKRVKKEREKKLKGLPF